MLAVSSTFLLPGRRSPSGHFVADVPKPLWRRHGPSAKIISSGGKTYLQVGLQGIKREAPKRPPLNICLLIDHSGSMGDEGKLEYARKAAIEVVDRLAPSDTIAVVVYNDTQQVLAPAQKARDKKALREKLAALQSGGSTDIYSALELGYREVAKGLDPRAVNQVILLSDGNVTAGISDLGAFGRLTAKRFDEGMQTTTVGMGLDYDEELMMTVAREGKGNYHFVKDAATIGDIFREELEDLTHVVAKALRLRIKLADGIELIRVLGSVEMEKKAVEAAKATERKIDERVYRELGITSDRQKIEDILGLIGCLPLGIAAWIMANRDLAAMDVGRMDPSGREMTNIGRILGIIATCIVVLSVLSALVGLGWFALMAVGLGAAFNNIPGN